MGEIQNRPFQLSFNASLKIDFQGSRVTSDGGAGLEGLTLSSGETEMDAEIDLLRKTDPPRLVLEMDVAVWEMESEAWSQELKRKLRVIHCERRYEAPAWKHERKQLRVVTSIPVEILPAGQRWTVGRSRWKIENGTFHVLTRDYCLTHNYDHTVAAVVVVRQLPDAGLLELRHRALSQCTLAIPGVVPKSRHRGLGPLPG